MDVLPVATRHLDRAAGALVTLSPHEVEPALARLARAYSLILIRRRPEMTRIQIDYNAAIFAQQAARRARASILQHRLR